MFVDVKFDFRTGNVSFWAGAKGGGEVGPSAKVVGGNAEFTAFKDEIDLSFTSSLTPGY